MVKNPTHILQEFDAAAFLFKGLGTRLRLQGDFVPEEDLGLLKDSRLKVDLAFLERFVHLFDGAPVTGEKGCLSKEQPAEK